MFLIADSGSTKTRWEFIQNGSSSTVYTSGINPFYKNAKQITDDLRNELLPHVKEKPGKIFFYGAGISQSDKVETVKQALNAIFPAAETKVEHDLLAAARATCLDAPGIACILGTGSNSCLFDGRKITDNVPSLGFILGDEGSGGYFGRKLLQAYFYRELPADLKSSLESKYDMRRDHVLNAVHEASMPSRVVASYAGFLTENNSHPFISNMLEEGFSEFLKRHVSKYENCRSLPVHFIGSIAFLNRDVLGSALEKNSFKEGVVLKSPMEGLVKYHIQNKS